MLARTVQLVEDAIAGSYQIRTNSHLVQDLVTDVQEGDGDDFHHAIGTVSSQLFLGGWVLDADIPARVVGGFADHNSGRGVLFMDPQELGSGLYFIRLETVFGSRLQKVVYLR